MKNISILYSYNVADLKSLGLNCWIISPDSNMLWWLRLMLFLNVHDTVFHFFNKYKYNNKCPLAFYTLHE